MVVAWEGQLEKAHCVISPAWRGCTCISDRLLFAGRRGVEILVELEIGEVGGSSRRVEVLGA